MSEKNWRRGRIVGPEDTLDLKSCALVAEVHSRAVRADDGGHVASYILVDGLEEAFAEDAMNFFSSQVTLLVDSSRLVEHCKAEFPALVTIRMTDQYEGYVAQCFQFDFLQTIPGDDVISQDGWDAFCVRQAMLRGEDVEDADDLPEFDERSLRRKVYANRAQVKEDRSPWLVDEYNQLRELTDGKPEGSEALIELADDMEAALNGQVLVGDSFSVVIPTRIERAVQDGAMRHYIPQTGREIVVAHGLDAVQAGKVLRLVEQDKSRFVDASQLMAGSNSKETLHPAFIVPDSGLNWISTDFNGRRSAEGYKHLQAELNTSMEAKDGEVVPMVANSAQR
ncbi:hypothetical protein [Erythrobacter aureus]|uniref:Uncharacterized protein n=1 Tax=Erythrobacter aureus TaxID=2182384 RepID=A0A345YJJ8_9SPHN|nr:hypothetical protein [Erythrobacter aureus]AXK44100.1 hypothetical protein DVR09_16745 [Erythrobacter aureus]